MKATYSKLIHIYKLIRKLIKLNLVYISANKGNRQGVGEDGKHETLLQTVFKYFFRESLSCMSK
jgi:hypothetical protein